MVNFTPGPWRRIGGRHIVAPHPEAPERRDRFVVICECHSGGPGIEQTDANEALIAASPTLYAALRRLKRVVEDLDAPMQADRPTEAQLAAALAQASDAIAVAQGR